MEKLQQYSDVAMRGEELVTTLDNLEALKHVKRMIQYIESRVEKIRAYLENRDRNLHVDVQRDSVQKEIRQVCNMFDIIDLTGDPEYVLEQPIEVGIVHATTYIKQFLY